MFTTEHFIWLILCAVFVSILSFCSIKFRFSLKTCGLIMTGISILSEVSKIMSDMLESTGGGMHLDPLALPFHLCSLMIFAVIYITFGADGKFKRNLINFISVLGVLGSIAALLIPTNGTDFSTVFAYQCFVYHAGLLWFALYLLISGEATLKLKNYFKNILTLLVLVFVMIYINGALSVYDTNFFYLTRPPMENLPFLNLDSGWYIYFIRILLTGFTVITLFHIPFIIHDMRNKHNRTAEFDGISLVPLEEDDRENFIIDNQKAFNYGALEEFGKRDDHFEEAGEIISRNTIENSIDSGVAYRIMSNGKKVGGVVVKIDGNHGELDLLFVSPDAHDKGIGYRTWCLIEKMYPEVRIWETVTPAFETRNIHFYVNRCGFHIVEFFNSRHPDPNDPDTYSEDGNDGMYKFEKIMK